MSGLSGPPGNSENLEFWNVGFSEFRGSSDVAGSCRTSPIPPPNPAKSCQLLPGSPGNPKPRKFRNYGIYGLMDSSELRQLPYLVVSSESCQISARLVIRCPGFPNLPGILKFRHSGISEFLDVGISELPGRSDLARSCRILPIPPNVHMSCQMFPDPAESLGDSGIQQFRIPENL